MLTTIVAFIVGVASSIIGNYIYDKVFGKISKGRNLQ